MSRRQIIRIDEELCTGCGACIPNCAEGALEIVDGAVRIVEERLCDGLGACLGACPENALTIEEREAEAFDERAVEAHLAALEPEPATDDGEAARRAAEAARAVFGSGGCPGARSLELGGRGEAGERGAARPAGSAEELPRTAGGARDGESLLAHWPIQLGLVNPLAPSFRGADLLVAADCAPVAYRMFHEDFLAGRSVVIACPKLDYAAAHLDKLAELFAAARPRSVTVVHMEVPCCFGLTALVERAARQAGLDAPIEDVTITVEGTAKSVATAAG